MSEIITIITQKPQWQTKIHDAKIVSKWKKELRAQGISGTVLDKAMELLKKSQVENYYGDIYKWHIEVGAAPSIWRGCQRCKCMICSEQEYLLRERNHYDENDEEYRDVQNTLKMFSKIKCKCQNLWVEDNLKFLRDNLYFQMNLVKSDLKQRFVTHVADFEARKTEKDYHPGSNDQMLDIIHPALYCFVKGVTPVVGDGEELMENTSLFQWIPSDFTVIRDPTTSEPIRTEIASYINNLDKTDPRNADLYQDISEIFTTMVPGFEKVLNKLQKDDRINALKKQTLYGFDDYGLEDEQDEETALSPPRQDIQLKDCQVIVKIASAQVNSDKPEFSEGSWHLEGVDSEKIIATGIYYYDMKDIEKSYLRFRTTLAQDMEGLSYPQDCPEFVRLHYGLRNFLSEENDNGIDTLIKLGRIPTKENLCLFFPNFLQHRVSPLFLKDGATEGHRSILVFFLINPFEKVISTTHIPTPQQETMSLANAKLYRELLMFERKYEYSEQNNFHQRGISLCEH